MFIEGYLALCSAVQTGTATELSGVTGYARQSIAFGEPVDGVTFSTVPYTFGMGVRWINNGQQLFPTPAGRAIYDAPTGGNLLLVLPFATPYARGRLPWDAGDVGHLRLFFTALQGTHRGEAYTGRIAAGAMAGLCSDIYDVVTTADLSQVQGQSRPLINAGAMTAGVGLSVNRGVLQASTAVPAGTE